MRIQAIFTELVFEHALRIRMKAETAASTPSPSTAPTPDTASLADTAVGTEGEHSAEGTEQTLQPSSASIASSSSGKGKGKAKEEDDDKDKDSNLVGKINNLVRTVIRTYGCVCSYRTIGRY